MKKVILVAGIAVACSASAQLLQNLTQAILQPEPAPAPAPVQVVQPQEVVQQQVVQPAVQQVTTTTVQPVQQVTTTVVQPVQQVTTTTVTPAAPVAVAPPPPPPTTIIVPAGYQTCPRCGGRGKEEHAMGFKLKRCKLCDGKGYLPPPRPPVHHRYHHRH